MKCLRLATVRVSVLVIGLAASLAVASEQGARTDESDVDHRLTLPEQPVELVELPQRPRPLIELGDRYLAPVEIGSGFTLPTGAVWQPSLLAWGTLRSALQAESGRGVAQAQWANRLDLFGQLSLTATERVVVGLEPFQSGSQFSGYRFGVDGANDEIVGDVRAGVQTLFFEGDVGELFPAIDRDERLPLDLGFMIGRVPVVFQDGFLVDDRMTACGLVRNSILASNTSNLRMSLIGAWDAVGRGNNQSDGSSELIGAFSEFDLATSTVAFDAIYVNGADSTDGLFGGVSVIRRIRERWNATTRLLGSYALDRETTRADDGVLGVLSLSVAPRGTHNVAYANLAGSFRNYTAAALNPDRGGPLGRVGILFEASGLGSIGSPLASDANKLVAGALGYQMFFSGGRTQVVFEVAGRVRHDVDDARAIGAGLRFQRALGRHFIYRMDAYAGSDTTEGAFRGGRVEIVAKF